MISAALLLAATLAPGPRVVMYDLPRNQIPTEIVRHAGELWFVSWLTEPKLQAYFGRITTRGRIRTFRAPEGHMPGFTTHAPDGTLWLSDASRPVFWRVSAKGQIGSVNATTPSIGIAFGPDGRLWCTHQSYAITRHGTDGSAQGLWPIPFDPPMTSTPPPPPGPTATSIAAGPDGALWFMEPYQGQIGRITTSGEMKMFQAAPIHGFNEIIAGPDGAMWFTTSDAYLGRITAAGEITKITTGFRAGPIATDSKGRIWYGDVNRAGYVDTDGSVHELEVPRAKSIRSMAEGPDGAMWFADQVANAIGRVELRPPAPRR